MDFKKLFRKDDKAVSPVIGVILMVAITVILAAAIGSSVFSKGTAQSAPQANFNMKSAGYDATNGYVLIEHLGGDPVNFGTGTTVKAYINGAEKATNASTIGVMNVGDTKTIYVTGATASNNVNIKIIDNTTSQLISDKNVRF